MTNFSPITGVPYTINPETGTIDYHFEPGILYPIFLWLEHIPEQIIEHIKAYDPLTNLFKIIETPESVALLALTLLQRVSVSGSFEYKSSVTYEGEASIFEPIKLGAIDRIVVSFYDTLDFTLTKLFRAWVNAIAPSKANWSVYLDDLSPRMIVKGSQGTPLSGFYATACLFTTDPNLELVTSALGGIAVVPMTVPTEMYIGSRSRAEIYMFQQDFKGIWFTNPKVEAVAQQRILPYLRTFDFNKLVQA